MAAFSFYPTKNLGCLGDGGAVASTDAQLANTARCLRDYGQTAKYEHTYLGLNSRLDELQAGLMRRVLLPKLASFTQRRRHIAQRYLQEISAPSLHFPVPCDSDGSVWHLFPVLVSEGRDEFLRYLQHEGIAAAIHYEKLIPDQGAMANQTYSCYPRELPRARRFAAQLVSLPINPFLSDDEISRVIEVCNRWENT
jgi:dTDP-4-amino-4,6-dideoxygalactose transaminase